MRAPGPCWRPAVSPTSSWSDKKCKIFKMTHQFWLITINLCSNECVWTLFKAKSSVLHPVSKRGDTCFVQLLLGYKANIDARNQVRKHCFLFSTQQICCIVLYLCTLLPGPGGSSPPGSEEQSHPCYSLSIDSWL